MSHLTSQQRELAAIGASLASNCIPCIKYHVQKGREAGLTEEEMAEAIEVADAVRKVPARKVHEAARASLGQESGREVTPPEEPACRSTPAAADSSGAAESPCCDSGGGL